MPIYEYVCDDCGHELEALQGMNDPELTDCPECATARLRRRISAAAFRLKGGGWYETDFKSGNRRNIAGEGEKSAGKEGKGESKADSKSDSKTESKPDSKTGDGGKAKGGGNSGSGSGSDKKAAAS